LFYIIFSLLCHNIFTKLSFFSLPHIIVFLQYGGLRHCLLANWDGLTFGGLLKSYKGLKGQIDQIRRMVGLLEGREFEDDIDTMRYEITVSFKNDSPWAEQVAQLFPDDLGGVLDDICGGMPEITKAAVTGMYVTKDAYLNQLKMYLSLFNMFSEKFPRASAAVPKKVQLTQLNEIVNMMGCGSHNRGRLRYGTWKPKLKLDTYLGLDITREHHHLFALRMRDEEKRLSGWNPGTFKHSFLVLFQKNCF